MWNYRWYKFFPHYILLLWFENSLIQQFSTMYLHEIFSPSLLLPLPPILPHPSASVFFILRLTWCKINKMAICICLLLILDFFQLEFFKGQLKCLTFCNLLNSQNLLQYYNKSTWNRSDRTRGPLLFSFLDVSSFLFFSLFILSSCQSCLSFLCFTIGHSAHY